MVDGTHINCTVVPPRHPECPPYHLRTRQPHKSSQRKRIYLACVNCRHRKVRCITTGDSPDTPCQRCVKHGLICDYVPVSLEREKSLFDTPPGEGSNSTHSPTMPPSWSQAPPHNGTYGRSNYAPPSAPHFNPSYGQPGCPFSVQFSAGLPARPLPSGFHRQQSHFPIRQPRTSSLPPRIHTPVALILFRRALS
ncbi:hypothetical protein C8F04DRAFT_1242204 [Mycena alexandri]|uniref:Zn(2)-C6 fungal-type domain-containing protein n=1 Tax=Mycena alexandri TaxID=1745969 RepID=A0AAD6S2S4_9AGAR|nr:hypothetical protein C8F04DRAFT_1242204 [Mycena alexandri]